MLRAHAIGSILARSTPASISTRALLTNVLLNAIASGEFRALLEMRPEPAYLTHALRHCVHHFLHLHGDGVQVFAETGGVQSLQNADPHVWMNADQLPGPACASRPPCAAFALADSLHVTAW